MHSSWFGLARAPRLRGRRAVFIAGLVCAALIASSVAPARAAGDGGENDALGSVVVGGFAIGDGLEGVVSERDGSLQIGLPVSGMQLRWDSRAAAVERSGLGPAWDWGLARVERSGGTRVVTASGAMHEPDATHPSGLAGYGARDVVFEQRAGTLEPRPLAAGAASGEVEYAFVLHEVGGTVSYFGASGDPVAQLDAVGRRTEWRWDPVVPHRLVETIDPDGVRTRLDWQNDPGWVLVTTSVDGAPDVTDQAAWRIELDGGRVSGVTDPLGGHIRVGYARGSGLLQDVTGPSGAITSVTWQAWADGVTRVDRVRTVDQASGAELSGRDWAPDAGTVLPSGWPVYGGEQDVFLSNDAGLRYSTGLSDGATRVESSFNSLHLIIERRVIGSTASGETVLREEDFTYPDAGGGALPESAALPGNWSHPTRTDVTFRDQRGGGRTVTESATFDDLGRVVEESKPDGTVSTTVYDPEIPVGRRLPVGLPVIERSAAPDGQVTTTTHRLDATRTAVLATGVTATRASTEGHDPDTSGPVPTVPVPTDPVPTGPVPTNYVEFEVDGLGTVTEQRVYPAGDRDAAPVVTRWRESVDPAAGTRSRMETVGVGTPGEASTAEVTSLVHDEVVATVDELGNTTRTELDALGRVVRVTDPLGRVTLTTHETVQVDGRNAVTTTMPDGVSVTEVHDVLGRTTEILDDIRDGSATPGHVRRVERRDHPAAGVEAVTDAWGAVTTTKTDVFGRPREVISPTGLVEVTVHDDVADEVTVGMTPTGKLADAEFVTTQRRDEAGRIAEELGRRADGQAVPTVTTSFDGVGRTLGTSSGTLSSGVEHDVYGNPVRTTFTPGSDHDAGGAPILEERRFDGLGHSVLKTVTDGESARPGLERVVDGLGRTVSETDQSGRVTTTAYTPDGLVAKTEAGSGQVTEHAYHPVTRVLTGTVVTSPIGESVRTAYEHDPRTDRVVGVWDPADRAGTLIRTEWDAHGNPTRVAYPDGHEIAHRYDEHGRRTHTIDIVGNVTTFEYDEAGRMRRLVQRDRRDDLLAEVEYERDRFDRVTRLVRGNGLVSDYTFTSASEIASEHTTKDGETRSRRVYEYDATGNLTQRNDTIVGPGTGAGTGAEETTVTAYRYDAYDRLIRSTEHRGESDGPIARDTAYSLAASDDVTVEVVTTDPGTPSEVTTTRRFAYDPLGGLTGVGIVTAEAGGTGPREVTQTQTYDAAGNLTVGVDGTVYTYDSANRPVSETAADGATTRTRYWADGSRRERTTAADGDETSIAFYWDDDTLVNDLHVDGHVDGAGAAQGVAAYLIGESRHARTTVESAAGSESASGAGAATAYLGADRHGSIVERSTEAGEISARYAYTDYGVPLHPEPGRGLERNPFGYAGEYTDPIGTQHLAARSYDPATMRFLTMDTAELHNLFNYADLNPITKVDPTGRAAQRDQPWNWVDVGFLALHLLSTFIAIAAGVSSVMRFIQLARTGFAMKRYAQQAAKTIGMTVRGTMIFEPPTATVSGLWGAFAATARSAAVNAATGAIGGLQLRNAFVEPLLSEQEVKVLTGLEIAGAVLGPLAARPVYARRWFVKVKRGELTTDIRGSSYGVHDVSGGDPAFVEAFRKVRVMHSPHTWQDPREESFRRMASIADTELSDVVLSVRPHVPVRPGPNTAAPGPLRQRTPHTMGTNY